MLQNFISPFLGKARLQKFWKKMYEISLHGMNIGAGGDFRTSGEINALNYVKKHAESEMIIFDVGANVGDYVNELLNFLDGKYTVHCFEPALRTYQILQNNVKDERVIKNNIGLSDVSGQELLYYNEEKSGLASLYKRQIESSAKQLDKTEQVQISTIDEYCERHQINYIDFLKMDIEGNEYKALCGAKRMLQSQKIGAIQIEFGGCNLDSRTYLRDYWNLLHENYTMYRLLKNGFCKIPSYDESMEIFVCGNYFFVKKVSNLNS